MSLAVGIDFGATNSAVAITDDSAGTRAMERYAESGGQGRLVQSIKSHLASELFSGTHAMGRHYRIEDLIALTLTPRHRRTRLLPSCLAV